MSLRTRTIPALINGISQQPAILRSPDQMEDELNTWSRLSSGLSRRPPTEIVSEVSGLNLGDATVHHINRDINERYTVIIDQGIIRVFDESTGEEKTVTAPLGWDYLDAAGPDYDALTVADYTFVINTKKVVALKGVAADHVVPDPDLRFPGGLTPRGIDLPVDGWRSGDREQYLPNPTAPGGFMGRVTRSDELPDPVCSGCVYQVLGDKETSFVSYYVMGDGSVWNETVLPGLQNAIDETTMPHALVREADGTFTFAPFSWQPRRVGDTNTNPSPPFIGRTIRDAIFYQNRLGFLVDESVVFSASGDYGDFWRRTVLDYIDSDGFAAAVTTTDVALLDYAVPFADGILLFSRQHQFSLTNGESGLSAHSVSIQPVTRYVMSPDIKPVPMGNQCHFASDASGSVAVQEYTRIPGADPTDAANITAHVDTLIPEGASQLIPAPDMDALFVLVRDAEDEADRSKMYAYQFFWNGDRKLQSAWRVWDFGDGKPVSGSYESGSLNLLMERPEGFYLEKIDLNPGATTPYQDHLLYLDRQVPRMGLYDSGSDTTSFSVPYLVDPDKVRVVRSADADLPESLINPSDYEVDGDTIAVPGDESATPVTIGHNYETRVVLSRQFPTDWQSRPLTTGRLVLHTFTLNLKDTVSLVARVYPYGVESGLSHDTVFSSKKLGTPGATLGEARYGSGKFTFSVAGSAQETRIELINDTPFNSTMVSAEWEGLYFNRAL